MTNTFNRVIMLAIIVGMLLLTVLLLMQHAERALGSVDTGSGGYVATSTRNFLGTPMASTTQLVTSSSRISGILGSFVITGAGAAPVTFYDATTSNANLRTITATSSLKVIADFPASTAAGTYTIDGTFNDGLLYVVTGSSSAVPTSTITYKLP